MLQAVFDLNDFLLVLRERLKLANAGNHARSFLEKILERLSASMFYNCMTFFLPRL
ncbi:MULTISPECIES: hypothetical protein [Pseudomonas]|uniref:hypothetical protein n=1 Tax=Pseudomonas TaxID=286 RepID=UPI001FF90664|nr:hypothetical protein [Pseudomonas emilianonis]